MEARLLVAADAIVLGGGVATVNAKSSAVASGTPEAVPAAGELSAARTDTRSLAVNARSGTNALPRPSGNPINRPVCEPLRDPLTVTALSSEGASAGKPICDPGEASGLTPLLRARSHSTSSDARVPD